MLSEKTRKILREALVLGLLIVGILAGRSTLADHYYVPTGSMQKTLFPGDRVFVDKRAYGFRIPFTNVAITDGDPVSRGDVVTFDSPIDGTRLIKRIVAVGGDEVVIQDGRLAINGEWLASPEDPTIEVMGGKKVQLDLGSGGGPNFRTIVGDGMVLAVGDHRGASRDGRMFGAVPEAEIYARAVAVYYRRGEGFSWIDL